MLSTSTKMENSYLTSDFLSDVELYYTTPDQVREDLIFIQGEEVHHIQKVMRHSTGEEIYITDGTGNIYNSLILDVAKDKLSAEIKSVSRYKDHLFNVTFCIPRLKNPDRFELALEKCTELGITDFIIYQAENSVAKGEKTERWNKILLAAMKQSLRSILPKAKFIESLKKITDQSGKIITFDQKAEKSLSGGILPKNEHLFFIFGPEGGFSAKEQMLLSNSDHYRLTNNRLRSETAIITAAALITTNH